MSTSKANFNGYINENECVSDNSGNELPDVVRLINMHARSLFTSRSHLH